MVFLVSVAKPFFQVMDERVTHVGRFAQFYFIVRPDTTKQ